MYITAYLVSFEPIAFHLPRRHLAIRQSWMLLYPAQSWLRGHNSESGRNEMGMIFHNHRQLRPAASIALALSVCVSFFNRRVR